MYRSLRYFQLSQKLDALPSPLALGHQVEDSPEYISIGKKRTRQLHCIYHYTLRGSGAVQFRQKEFRTAPETGFLCIINDPEMMYFYPSDGEEPWEFIWFGYQGDHVRTLTRELLDRYGPLFSLPISDSNIQRFLGYGRQGDRPIKVDCYEGAEQVNNLLFGLGRVAMQREQRRDFPLAGRFAALLEERGGDWTVNELAERLGISREHLSRMFRKSAGQSLSLFLQQYKCTHACQLLATTEILIDEIAGQLGFANASNFTRMFKAHIGMTPKDFRIAQAQKRTGHFIPCESGAWAGIENEPDR